MNQGQYNYEIYLLLTHGRRYHQKRRPCGRCDSVQHTTEQHTPAIAYAEFRKTARVEKSFDIPAMIQ